METNGLLEEERRLNDELEALSRVLHAFKSYKDEALLELQRWERNFDQLKNEHKSLLSSYSEKIKCARGCVERNQVFFDAMVDAFYVPNLKDGASTILQNKLRDKIRPKLIDFDKTIYVLKNIVRDWSLEGLEERAQSYGLLCQEICKRLPLSEKNYRILVPGCGLGRLPFELCKLGYEVEGNEFNYFMLIAASYVLNQIQSKAEIHPWVLSSSNQLSTRNMIRAVSIPDVSMVPDGKWGSMSMSAGEFTEIYSKPEAHEAYDCVVTCFFIDCAHNILQFIDVIFDILKSGGYWINLGPLLYHWADAESYLSPNELSVELPLDELKQYIEAKGFNFLLSKSTIASFNSDSRSMVRNCYDCAFWTVTKSSN